MGHQRVSVVIPNYDGAHHLRECLDSLHTQTYKDFETIVVDNGSTDTSLKLMQEDYPWVQVMDLGENKGFAGGCNAGIRASDSEFVVLLNNDTRAEPDYLEHLVRAMDSTPEAGFAASKMLNYEPPHVIDSAGDFYSVRRSVPVNIGHGEPAESHAVSAWVFGACAGGAIYRRSLFDDVGLFDEDFFMICEDVDLDFRAQLAGHRCLYVPEAIVFHKRGVSITVPSPQIRALALRNRIWAAGKGLPTGLLFRCSWNATIRFLRLVGWFFKMKIQGRRPFPEGYFGDGIYLREITRAFVQLPRKRRAVQRTRRVPVRYMAELLSAETHEID